MLRQNCTCFVVFYVLPHITLNFEPETFSWIGLADDQWYYQKETSSGSLIECLCWGFWTCWDCRVTARECAGFSAPCNMDVCRNCKCLVSGLHLSFSRWGGRHAAFVSHLPVLFDADAAAFSRGKTCQDAATAVSTTSQFNHRLRGRDGARCTVIRLQDVDNCERVHLGGTFFYCIRHSILIA